MPTMPNNDTTCGWSNILDHRKHNASLKHDLTTKWLIIGAGYSGLSAAITLAEECPNDQIILLDANGAGEGASARNSGYLVDSTLNDGHLSDTGLKTYKQKYQLGKKAADQLKDVIDKYSIECDWNECGKYYASSSFDSEDKLNTFMSLLDSLGLENKFYNQADLANKIGTDFYKMAVKTYSGAMLQPAALARGLINALPENVALYENTPVTNIQYGDKHLIRCKDANITADKLIIAINGFMPTMRIKKSQAFPLLLTASLTRPLNETEQQAIRQVSEWGLLSANHMGATIRYTSDKRIMIRNTVEVSTSFQLSKTKIRARVADHFSGLKRRFPFLADNIIAHSWAGVTCISANNANIFDQIYRNCWTIGCYNGGGIGLANLFGREIAYKALNKTTATMVQIEARPKPNWLPPQPFLNFGIKLKLAKDRFFAKGEI